MSIANLSELPGGEDNPLYQHLKAENYGRHYDFMNSTIQIALDHPHPPRLSQSFIKNLNCHAIAGLHEDAGQYRKYPVYVGTYRPPASGYVPMLMEEFVVQINDFWETSTPIPLSCFALWRINNIHPFVNGNGRTARAVFYFILCTKIGGFLPEGPKLLESLSTGHNRTRYVQALKNADAGGDNYLGPLTELVAELIQTTSES